MATGIKEGIGASVTFGTSTLVLNFVDISVDGISVEDIATFDQSTTGGKTYVAGTLKEGGTVTLNCNTNNYDILALHGAIGVAQTITVLPGKVVSTDVVPPSYAFTGYVKSMGATVGAIDGLQTTPVTIKVAGTVTPVSGSVS